MKRKATPSSTPRKVNSLSELDKICEQAALVMNMQSAMLFLNQNGESRVIASHGLPVPLRKLAWSFDKTPFAAGETFMATDASKNTFAMATRAEFGLPITGSIIRMPVEVKSSYLLALYVFSDSVIKKPAVQKVQELEEIASQVRLEFKPLSKLMLAKDFDLNISRTLEQMKTLTEEFERPAALFDSELKIFVANTHAARLLGMKHADMTGKRHADFAPLNSSAVEFLLKRSLESRQSTPDFEVVVETSTQHPRVFRYQVSPFSPIDSPRTFLFVAVTEIGRDKLVSAPLMKEAKLPESARAVPDAAQSFLLDTLIKRRTIRHRKDISYLTLRTWRQPIRSYQINAFKALKTQLPPSFPEEISSEIHDYIDKFIGFGSFKAIVPVPCGHSSEDRCLSLELARHLSKQVNIPVVQAFLRQPHKGTSHPKQNARRPAMILQRQITEPVLLIDDVATSGRHIEEAVALLRPACGTVLSVAWIGSDGGN